MSVDYQEQFQLLRDTVAAISSQGKPVRVVVTGSRDWENQRTLLSAVVAMTESGEIEEVIHGQARGVDQSFASFCERFSVKLRPVPAEWRKHDEQCPDWHTNQRTCKMAGHRRNREMAEMKPDICIAFCKDESRGTTGMVKLCEARGIPVILFSE